MVVLIDLANKLSRHNKMQDFEAAYVLDAYQAQTECAEPFAFVTSRHVLTIVTVTELDWGAATPWSLLAG